MTDVPELTTSQEEDDTKVFVCCAHTRDNASVCIFTADSDIPLYALYFKEHIGMDVYVEIGVKNTRRRISVSAIFNFHGHGLIHRKRLHQFFHGPSVSTAITAFHSFPNPNHNPNPN